MNTHTELSLDEREAMAAMELAIIALENFDDLEIVFMPDDALLPHLTEIKE